jgi:DNA-directed RNA polymerase specialized sigma24 family protein
MNPRHREIVVARVELQWSLAEIAQRFGMRTADAARMAVSRALKRLSAEMTPPRQN